MAGSLAGTTGQALTYPLDRARAVMAVTKVGEFRNIFHVFSTIYHREGILGKQFEINLIHCVAKVYAVLPFYDVKCLCS